MYSKKSNHVFLKILVTLLVLAGLGAGGWYWYDNNVDRSGWGTLDGNTVYLDFHGKPQSGVLEIEGKTYLFGDDFAMRTGWQEVNGQRCFFGADGALASGWTENSGKRIYLDNQGHPVSGWMDLDGSRYFFGEDSAPATGWQTVDGKRYHFTDTGIMQTGWLEDGEETYFLTADGSAMVGDTVLDEKVYYFYSDGAMHHGWIDKTEGRAYYGDDGAMVTGWQEIEGKRRFFDENGIMKTGWLQEGEYRYYMLEDGTPATSPTEIDGTMCYFSPKGIYVLLVNYANAVPKNYDPDLVTFSGYSRVSKIAEEPLRRMINDCKATGINVWLNCAYRSYGEQQQIMQERTLEHMKNDGLSEAAAYKKALETVAVPGYSEHQVGLAMDIVCSVLTDWLIEHCWEYGFILRYPEGKQDITHISYEHWHFRYVGTEVSMDMKGTGLCLEEYLGAA